MNVHYLSAASSTRATRRRLLGLIGAGSAAAVATLLPRNGARAGHDSTNVMHLGEQNSAPAGTALHATTEGPALSVQNDGTTDSSGGVWGVTQGLKPAVMGEAVGTGEEGVGVVGVSSLPPFGDHFGDGPGTGVRGSSGNGTGVRGISETGWGVHGGSTDGVGVVASAAPAGEALHVAGRAVFETAGSGVVPAGANDVFVTSTAVGPASHVMVTLTGDPGNRQLRWIELSAGSGFTVHLSQAPPKARPATPFTYLVVDYET
jgi:hypothetical protein